MLLQVMFLLLTEQINGTRCRAKPFLRSNDVLVIAFQHLRRFTFLAYRAIRHLHRSYSLIWLAARLMDEVEEAIYGHLEDVEVATVGIVSQGLPVVFFLQTPLSQFQL